MTDHELLEAIHSDVAGMKVQIADLCGGRQRLEKDYYGNGDGGTRRDVTTLKAQMKVAQWLGSAFGAAAITGAVGAIFALVKRE